MTGESTLPNLANIWPDFLSKKIPFRRNLPVGDHRRIFTIVLHVFFIGLISGICSRGLKTNQFAS